MPHLSWNEVRDRAIRFSRDPVHTHARSERAEKQTFWNDFFEVFGLRRALMASFEENVRNLKGNTNAIDLLWKGKLLVEHKSFGEDLGPAQAQAFDYIGDLARADRSDEIPRFVLVSDFARFVLYDLEPDEQRDLPLFAGQRYTAHSFTLAEFPQHIRQFAFMLGQTRVRLDPEDPANEKAYARMCELHDALGTGGFAVHDLERLLVRILFCLFAEDTFIFAEPEVFTRFIRTQTREDGSDLGARLNELFAWLDDPRADGPLEDTDPFYGFRYVNGGLFRDPLHFARFNRVMRDALLFCCDFQWAKISPAVFGSLFQGVMEDRARRQQGAHYTSERDIMKVLRSLFLDDLRAEWERVKADRSTRRHAGLEGFHQRLRSLQFLDPACGCGNFLVLAYRELRTLEIDVVRELTTAGGGQGLLPIVNVDQFHGIEYSEWPVRIAEVALWLMDHQMNAAAGEVFGRPVDRLPLTTAPHIVQGNALRLDWNDVLPRERCSYVLGNPPFVGKKEQNAEQKADMTLVWGETKGKGVLDYVTGWYVKAARYVDSKHIPVAFVSTNSITQGEQVGILWGEIFQHYHLKICFAHRTFAWQSESRGAAHVHVVIVGFAGFDPISRTIFDYENQRGEPSSRLVTNISPYLLEGSNITIPTRENRLSSEAPEMMKGSEVTDNGHLLLSDAERVALLNEYPQIAPYVRPFLGGKEYINGLTRWCLWLKDAQPGLVRESPTVVSRLQAVKQFRLDSPKTRTVELAAFPSMFGEDRQPSSNYLLVPKVSSERRDYLPIGFLPPEYIVSGSALAVTDATSFHFGILSSRMHMAWTRVVCGRMKSDYQYSVTIVYNNFPWPNPTPAQRLRVEEKARAVLAAREPHLPPRGMSTLADLYDPLTMPPALAKAHADLDRAVERCYRPEPFHADRERVEHLFRLYEQLTAPLLPTAPRTRGARSKTSAAPPRSRRGRTPGLPATEPPADP